MVISQLNEQTYISTLWLRMREKIQGQGLDNVNVEPIRHWLKLGDQQMCNGWLNLEELIITLIHTRL